jgi:hypothetical protein
MLLTGQLARGTQDRPGTELVPSGATPAVAPFVAAVAPFVAAIAPFVAALAPAVGDVAAVAPGAHGTAVVL